MSIEKVIVKSIQIDYDKVDVGRPGATVPVYLAGGIASGDLEYEEDRFTVGRIDLGFQATLSPDEEEDLEKLIDKISLRVKEELSGLH